MNKESRIKENNKALYSSFLIPYSGKTNGFTLIELLVVISIIGILATMVFFSFTAAQRQARDAQRKSDLKQYQTLLEIFAGKNNGNYPDDGSTSSITISNSCSTLLGLTTCPSDPKNTSPYLYRYNSDGPASLQGSPVATQYVLTVGLESKSGMSFVICSTGKIGERTTPSVSGGACPL